MQSVGVILAAGAGRKFWPFNEVRNKCAFPICNVPNVVRIVRQLRELRLDRILVVTGAQEGSVRAALRCEAGSNLELAPQSGVGTAAAVASALATLKPDDNLLVVHGDVVVSLDDLRSVWALADAGAAGAALSAPLGHDQPGDWICCTPGEERPSGGLSLSGVEGHGRDGTHRLAGVYALGPQARRYIQAASPVMRHVPVGGMPPAEAELADALADMSDEGLDVAAVLAERPCADLDKPWHILEATEAALDEMALAMPPDGRIDPTAQISDNAEIDGPIHVGPGATIGPRVVITGPAWIGAGARVLNGAIVGSKVVIGERARVSDYCQVSGGSVIGADCVVGHGAELDGVMLDGAYVYHYSEIYGVVGERVDIGAATVCGSLRFDDGSTVHRLAGRREFPQIGANCTYFGDYSRTGVNVITQPGVKIGSYSCVGPGVVLYEDVSSRTLRLLRQETVDKEWGPERYGW